MQMTLIPDRMPEFCEICATVGKRSQLKVYQINLEEAIKLCEDDSCNYPIGLDKVLPRKLEDVIAQPRRKLSLRQPAQSFQPLNGFIPRPRPLALSSQAPQNVIRPQPVAPHIQCMQVVPPCPIGGTLEHSPRPIDSSSKQAVVPVISPQKSTSSLSLATQSVQNSICPSMNGGDLHDVFDDIPFDNFIQSFDSDIVKTSNDFVPPISSSLGQTSNNFNQPFSSCQSKISNNFTQSVNMNAKTSNNVLEESTGKIYTSEANVCSAIMSNSLSTESKTLQSSTTTSGEEVTETATKDGCIQEELLTLGNEMDIDTSEVTEVIDLHLSLDEFENLRIKNANEKEFVRSPLTEKSTLHDENSSSNGVVEFESNSIPSTPFIPQRSNLGAKISPQKIKGLTIETIVSNPADVDDVISQEVEVATSADEGSPILGDGTTYFVVETNSKGKRKLNKLKEHADVTKVKKKEKSKRETKRPDETDGSSKCNAEIEDNKNSQLCPDAENPILKSNTLPSLDMFKFFPQWQNEEALCWLDVVLCLFVHSQMIRELASNEFDLSHTVLVTLFKAYQQACKLVNKYREQTVQTQMEAARRTRSGRLISDLEEVDSDTSLESPNTEMLKEICKMNPNAIKTGAGLNCSKDFLSMLNSDEQENYRNSFTILKEIREEIWEKMQPRLQCVKGKNDSPVLAIPLLVKDNIHIEKKCTVHYDFHFTCTACGHKQVDSEKKILPTFPSTQSNFTMKEPVFLRPCFKCEAANQKRCMKFTQLSGVLLLHFAEGLPHSNWKKLEFWHGSSKYTVTGFVQYRNDPDHFVTWIRRAKDNKWIEFDDLKSPICRYESKQPNVDASQIHIVMWEVCRQKEQSPPTKQAESKVKVKKSKMSEKVSCNDQRTKKAKANSRVNDKHSISIGTGDDMENNQPLETCKENETSIEEKGNGDEVTRDQKLRVALAKLWKPKPEVVTKIREAKENKEEKTNSKKKRKNAKTKTNIKNEWQPVDKVKLTEQKYCGTLYKRPDSEQVIKKQEPRTYLFKNRVEPKIDIDTNGFSTGKKLNGECNQPTNNRSVSRNSIASVETAASKNKATLPSTGVSPKLKCDATTETCGAYKTDYIITSKIHSKKTPSVKAKEFHSPYNEPKLQNGHQGATSDINHNQTVKLQQIVGKSKYCNHNVPTPVNLPKTTSNRGGSRSKTQQPKSKDPSPLQTPCSTPSMQYSVPKKSFGGFMSKSFDGYKPGKTLISSASSSSIYKTSKTQRGIDSTCTSPALSVKSEILPPMKRKTSISNLIKVKRFRPQFYLDSMPYSGYATPKTSSTRSSPVSMVGNKEGDILKDLYAALDILPHERQGALDISAIEESSGCLQTMDDFLDQIL